MMNATASSASRAKDPTSDLPGAKLGNGVDSGGGGGGAFICPCDCTTMQYFVAVSQ
jgi:hypothetical protein